MTKRYSLASDEKEVAELNISPLIDMVFILLIFFIVTTVFVEEPGVDILKPPALTSRDLAKNSILIAITNTNEVVYGGQNIGIAGVRPIVRRLTLKEPMPVILQVDEYSSAGIVVRVIDESKIGGAEIVSISTKNY